jgi:hypothetical protein
VTNDTAALQAALDAMMPGGTLVFPVGVYLASELVIPEKADITLMGAQGHAGAAGSVVKMLPASSGRWLAAAAGYVAGANWTGAPLSIVDLTFQGSGSEAANFTAGVIIMNWRARVSRCFFTSFSAGLAGLLVTAVNIDGFPIHTTQVNSRITENSFLDNAQHGFMIQDKKRNVNTDYFLSENFAYRNGGYGFALETTAGGLVAGNHLYSNALGDVWCGIGSKALRLMHNYLEGPAGLAVATINPGASVMLANNFFEGTASITANDGNASLVSTGNVFSNACPALVAASGAAASTEGCMRLHGYRGHVLTARSVNDQFADETTSPYAVHGTVRVLTAPVVPFGG